MKKMLALALLLGLLPQVATAQITVPYTFTSGTTISAAQMNANFAAVADALNRTGGTMTGGVVFGTDNLFDLGASGASRPRRIYVGTEVVSPLFTGALAGNASTATTLQTARTIWGQSFNGSANVSGAFSGATTGDFSGAVTIGGTLGVTGNVTVDSGTFHVDAANNRVGVGTTSPAVPLAVSSSASSPNVIVGVTAPNASNGSLHNLFRLDAGSDGTLGSLYFIAASYPSATGSSRYVQLYAGDNAAFRNIVFNLSGGNVGIGTSSPAYKLEVNGTLGVTGMLTASGGITGSLTGNASTASALAANPTDCSAGQFATAIAANGNLTCEAPVSAGYADGSATAPSIFFTDDTGTNTGIYRAGENSLGIALGGLSKLTITGSDPRMVVAASSGTAGDFSPSLLLEALTNDGFGDGSPARLVLEDSEKTQRVLWVDDSGQLRISGAANYLNTTVFGRDAGDQTFQSVGTVVGTQTSQRATKEIAGEFTDNAGALALLTSAPVFEFAYRNGAFHGETFVGITTDDTPELGMDQGRSFNPVNANGYTIAAIKELLRRIEALEARVAELESRR